MMTDPYDIQGETEHIQAKSYPGGPAKYLEDMVAYRRSPEGRKQENEYAIILLVFVIIIGFVALIVHVW
jgi:hypothetical protein